MEVVILGSGNVATHLSKALKKADVTVKEVSSRSKDLSAIVPMADMYIIAVSDDAIQQVASSLPLLDGVVVHTSGSTPLTVFNQGISNFGVLYPFQTFSKEKDVEFKNVPLLIEASNNHAFAVIKSVAALISTNVQACNSQQRKTLHIAAVFACNFTNHLYSIAAELLADQDLDFDLLRPLIAETAAKVGHSLPETVQTGPAIREDYNTINTHLELLRGQQELLDIYTLLTNRIISGKKKNQD